MNFDFFRKWLMDKAINMIVVICFLFKKPNTVNGYLSICGKTALIDTDSSSTKPYFKRSSGTWHKPLSYNVLTFESITSIFVFDLTL